MRLSELICVYILFSVLVSFGETTCIAACIPPMILDDDGFCAPPEDGPTGIYFKKSKI